MDKVGVVWRTGELGSKVFPAEAVGKRCNISNQAEVVKAVFWREGETFRENRGFRSSENLGGEINNEWVRLIRLESCWEREVEIWGRVAGMSGGVESLKVEARQGRPAKRCGE